MPENLGSGWTRYKGGRKRGLIPIRFVWNIDAETEAGCVSKEGTRLKATQERGN